MLEYHRFTGEDIARYMPFIEQAVLFHDEHYRFRNRQRTGEELDQNGKLVIYPANTLEHHPNARNPTLPIVGLHQILTRLLELPDEVSPPECKPGWRAILGRLPDLPVVESGGRRILRPAENFSHRSWHMPEMFGLWPFETYGQGLPWGGAGMVGLQEMLLQTHPPAPASLHGKASDETLRLDADGGEKLRLLPAWPKDWDARTPQGGRDPRGRGVSDWETQRPVTRQNVGAGPEFAVWCRFDSRRNRRRFSTSINACRRFATGVPRVGTLTMGSHPWLLPDVASRLGVRGWAHPPWVCTHGDCLTSRCDWA
jgi:hypothetical protein